MTAVRPAPGPRAAARGRRRTVREQRLPILNRELSWLEFNARVLHEAGDERNRPLDRVRSLFFFVNNLDEFFQVRVVRPPRQELSGSQAISADGRTAAEQLDAIRARVLELMAEQGRIFAGLRRELAAEGIEILDYDEVPDHHEALRVRFHDEIYPVLTPLAVDPGHPFPYISTLTLSIAVGLRDPDTGEQRFARVKIPPLLPRLMEVEPGRFVLLDQVIEANLDELFRGMEILETHLFRVTRDADIAIEEDEADDLLLAIEEEIRRRRFGEAVRLEVERSMPEVTRQILSKGIGILDDDVYEVAGMLDLTALWQLVDLDRPDLKSPPYTPVIPPRLVPHEDDEPVDVFAQIRAGDLLVHHPYESFTASVERFIAQAAEDPDVLTIKQTLYRTSGDSPIVQNLIKAAERGKQVVVLVEIKARFDEEANIVWARRLEQAGAHVVYGLVGLKTHSKVALVVRREAGGLRRYVHIGTGNYNSEDRPLVRRHRPALVPRGAGRGRHGPVQLADRAVAPARVPAPDRRPDDPPLAVPRARRARGQQRARRDLGADHHQGQLARGHARWSRRSTRPRRRASRSTCIVRGACCLIPGVEGLSEHIRVRSVIGEFLEHSRIWMFANGGRPEWYIGSADLMERNLDRRVEVVTPVEDIEAQARLARIVDVLLADNRRSWQLDSDGRWQRTEILESVEGTIDTFAVLKDDAALSVVGTDHAHHAGVGAAGSMDPRA